jgi:adenylylsulfate kinase (EC 2.7.1.25)/sulfate adenylyltransferase subunit 1 (EC 2.7.7.4)
MSNFQPRLDKSDVLRDRHEEPLLCIVACNSTNDGKTTLIEHLLPERLNHGEAPTPHASQANQQTGNYRLLAVAERRILVAEIPDHPQFTRRLAAAAATADLALIRVEASQGLRPQTRRHTRIVAMMGVRRVILVVSRMDREAFDQSVFESIEREFRAFAEGLGLVDVQVIPLFGLQGENVRQPSTQMPWYRGPSLLQALEGADRQTVSLEAPMRLPVEQVLQTERAPTILCGRLAAGTLRPGDAVRVLPSGQQTRIETLQIDGQVRAQAGNGEAVSLTLADPLPVACGDVLVAAEAPPEVADQFEVRLLWLGEQPMTPGRQYLLQLAGQEAKATVTHIKYREDSSSGARLAAKTLKGDAVATVNLSTAMPLVFEPHAVNRTLGSFVLSDRQGGETVGVGTIDFALRRASNIHWQALEIDKASRAALKGQTPRCLWFTGLSGSGKSTIASLLEKRLHAEGRHTYVLDGDNVRHGLNRDLGFTEADRVENIRRVAEVAKLMTDAGLIVLVSFISPFVSERKMARELFAAGEFIEVFVDTPLDECERRDVKGLYAKARRGELKNFTGIDSAYEPSIAPEVHLFPARSSPQDCVETLLRMLD